MSGLTRRAMLAALPAWPGLAAAQANIVQRGFSTAESVQRGSLVPPQVAPPCAPGSCRFAGQRVRVLMLANHPVRDALLELQPEFEAATGARLDFEIFPRGEGLARMYSDLTQRRDLYDVMFIDSSWLGDLVEAGHLLALDKLLQDPRFPRWEPEAVLPAARRLLSYDGALYMVADDHDAQVLYYRRDLLEDARHRAAFERRHGYALAVPQTWEQLRDMAAYFDGLDLNDDGQPDHGILLPQRVGSRFYLSLSASYVLGPENPVHYWFHPTTMAPLVDSPGHVRALEMLMSMMTRTPQELRRINLGKLWDLFLAGRSAFALTWGDLGGLAQQPGSRVQGRLGTAPLPGSKSYFHPLQQRWIEARGVNQVGNTSGGSWAGVISSRSKTPEASYFLLALKASRAKSAVYAARGWDSVDIGRSFHLLPPQGTAELQTYRAAGWSEADLRPYLLAYHANYSNPVQLPFLRLPGAIAYVEVLNQQLQSLGAGHASAQAALQAAALGFDEITLRRGRAQQLRAFQRSWK